MTLNDKIAALSLLWRRACEVFPYFDRLDLDWDEQYRVYLDKVMACESDPEVWLTLMEFMNLLGDGHTGFTPPASWRKERGTLPFTLGYCAEGYFVRSIEKGGESQLLGLIRRIGGRDMGELLREAARYLYSVDGYVSPSGLSSLLPLLLSGEETELETDLGVYRFAPRHGDTPLVSSPPADTGEDYEQIAAGAPHLRLYGGGILYAKINDLLRDGASESIGAALQARNVRAVILDLRENVGGMTMYGARIAELFIDGQFHGCRKRTRTMVGVDLASASQFAQMSPEKIRALVGDEDVSGTMALWRMQGFRHYTDSFGAPDHKSVFSGPCVLLTSRGTVSAAEDLTAMFKSNGRARLIGTPTYGSSGTPLLQPVPGGGTGRVCSVGYKLLDGTEFIGRGIMPDLQVEETIGTLRRGLDIPLIAALSVLR